MYYIYSELIDLVLQKYLKKNQFQITALSDQLILTVEQYLLSRYFTYMYTASYLAHVIITVAFFQIYK